MKIFKNLFLLVVILGVIILSFWVSFLLSKNLLVSAKKTTTADLLTTKPTDIEKFDNTIVSPETASASSEKQVKISFEVESVSTGNQMPDIPEDTKEVQKNAPKEKLSIIPVKKLKPIARSNADYMAPKLIVKNDDESKPKVSPVSNYKIQSGIFSKKSNANFLLAQLKKMGYQAQSDTFGKYYRVYVLAENLSEARIAAKNIKAKGYEAVIRRK